MRWSPYSNTTMLFVSVIWEKGFMAQVKVTNTDEGIHTLFAKIYHPLRHHMKSVDVSNVVFSLKAYGPELDMNSTFATLFGPTAEKVDLYIGYRPRRSGRTARITYGE